MILKTKIDAVCSRVDSCGLKAYVQQLNELIEQGYRFHVSDLFSDLPRLRNGFPKFTMSLPGHVDEVDKASPEHIEQVLEQSWYKDKEAVQAFIDRLEAATNKAETMALVEEIGIILPEDKKQHVAQRAWLIGQLKTYL